MTRLLDLRNSSGLVLGLELLNFISVHVSLETYTLRSTINKSSYLSTLKRMLAPLTSCVLHMTNYIVETLT